jgi:RNA polymerase sigma factor (TIGR02999 family)
VVDDDDRASLAERFAAAEGGDPQAARELFAALYGELHRLARRQLHANASGVTLGATTLLHEAYLNLSSSGAAFQDRARFFAYAARAMRGLIVDYVRERRALKRGGEFHLTAFDTEVAESVPQLDELTTLNDALDALAHAEPPLAELVELKFFCGFDFADIAAMRGVSERTVQRDWAKARLYLHDALREP